MFILLSVGLGMDPTHLHAEIKAYHLHNRTEWTPNRIITVEKFLLQQLNKYNWATWQSHLILKKSVLNQYKRHSHLKKVDCISKIRESTKLTVKSTWLSSVFTIREKKIRKMHPHTVFLFYLVFERQLRLVWPITFSTLITLL